MNSQSLIQAYRNEQNVKIKDRMFLVKCVTIDKQIPSHIAKQIGKVRSWSYKWLERYEQDGINGLKDKPRSGRPSSISQQKLIKIQQKISENKSGWSVKQVMNLIYEKSGVKYHEVHVYRLLHQWEFVPKVATKRFVNSATNKEKLWFKKNLKNK